ncbi:MAG: DUF2845 domain-containing protein [Rhodanobacter sp.]
MRMCLIIALLVFSAAIHANSTLRVGNQVLSAGDTQERVIDLLGRPSSKSHRRSTHRRSGRRGAKGRQGGEQWRYRHDGHATVVTIVDGRVTEIEDRRL